MSKKQTTLIRISAKAHQVLRYLAYKQNKRIIKIIDELLKIPPSH